MLSKGCLTRVLSEVLGGVPVSGVSLAPHLESDALRCPSCGVQSPIFQWLTKWPLKTSADLEG